MAQHSDSSAGRLCCTDAGSHEDLQDSKVDIRAVDATMGYYMKGTLLDRLEADVIAPAKALLRRSSATRI